MNSIFNFKRFWKVIQNEYLLKGTSLLMFIGVLIVITFLFFSFFYLINEPVDFPVITAITMIIFLTGQLFIINIHFSELTYKEKTQFLLLLPASKAEKFTVKSIASFIIYPLFCFLYFHIFIRLIHLYNATFSFGHRTNIEAVDEYLSEPFVIPTIIVAWIFFSFTALLAVNTFHKHSYLKLIGSWLAFFFLLTILTFIINAIMYGQFPTQYLPFGVVAFNPFNTNTGVYDMNKVVSLFEYCPYIMHYITSFIAISCFIIANIKFNERSV